MPYWAVAPYGHCTDATEFQLMSVDPSDATAIPALVAMGTKVIFSIGGWNFPRFAPNLGSVDAFDVCFIIFYAHITTQFIFLQDGCQCRLAKQICQQRQSLDDQVQCARR